MSFLWLRRGFHIIAFLGAVLYGYAIASKEHDKRNKKVNINTLKTIGLVSMMLAFAGSAIASMMMLQS